VQEHLEGQGVIALSSATETATQDARDIHALEEVAHDRVGADPMAPERGGTLADLPPENARSLPGIHYCDNYIPEMGTKSRERVVRRLREAESRRAAVVDELAQTDVLIIGSLSEVKRRCGKPSCHCAERPGHLQAILMSVEEGRRRCQVIRQGDLTAVRQAVERYRAFRVGLRLLSTLDSKVLALLKELRRLRDQGYE